MHSPNTVIFSTLNVRSPRSITDVLHLSDLASRSASMKLTPALPPLLQHHPITSAVLVHCVVVMLYVILYVVLFTSNRIMPLTLLSDARTEQLTITPFVMGQLFSSPGKVFTTIILCNQFAIQSRHQQKGSDDQFE
ncbi:hypothetical protein BaRGS_00016585 [Batillaria attramentaria]|uniref:Uncharacterized protein n=1 Tax=Batillaria attramentaria TaxID=370345 RepID=A0ABD0KYP2_9CAEN